MRTVLYHGTVRALPLAEQLRVATAIGAEALTIGPREYAAMGMAARDIRAMAADAGVAIEHIDPFIRWVPDVAFEGGAPLHLSHPTEEELFRVAEALEARSVSVVGMFPHGALGLAEMTDRFGTFCAKATAQGLRCDLEFVPIWGLPDLATALAVLEGAGAANAGLMFDIWHFRRGTPDDDLLRRTPGRLIHGVQLSDALPPPPDRDMLDDSRNHRLPPGEGDFEVREVVAILRAIGGLNKVGPEIFSADFDRRDADQIAEKCCAALGWALGGRGDDPC